MNVVDTSVAVAAALPWHEAHGVASAAVGDGPGPLLAQVGIETYSVLTRLPPPLRVAPAVAWQYLRTSFSGPPLTLEGPRHSRLLELAADRAIGGGAVYDALVAATAAEAGATLLTLDRRAERTYRLVGVEYRLVA